MTAHGSPAHQSRRFGTAFRYVLFAIIAIAIYAIVLWRVLVLGGALSPAEGVAPATLGEAILQALTRFDETGDNTQKFISFSEVDPEAENNGDWICTEQQDFGESN